MQEIKSAQKVYPDMFGVQVNEASSYMRLKDSCITQLEDRGPSRTCDENEEEEEEEVLNIKRTTPGGDEVHRG